MLQQQKNGCNRAIFFITFVSTFIQIKYWMFRVCFRCFFLILRFNGAAEKSECENGHTIFSNKFL